MQHDLETTPCLTRCTASKTDSFQHSPTLHGSAIVELLEDGELSAVELIEKLRMEQANIYRVAAFDGANSSRGMLTVVDQFTRECLCLHADTSPSGEKVATALDTFLRWAWVSRVDHP